MIKNIKKLGTRGDTIVEVLLCLAILGVVLGSATVVVNNNRRTILGTQERSVALKLVQGQIDQALGLTGTSLTGSFCVHSGTRISAPLTHSNCLVNRAGQPSSAAPNYRLVTTGASSNGGYLLTSRATWDMPNGVQGNVTIVHRIYP